MLKYLVSSYIIATVSNFAMWLVIEINALTYQKKKIHFLQKTASSAIRTKVQARQFFLHFIIRQFGFNYGYFTAFFPAGTFFNEVHQFCEISKEEQLRIIE